MLIKQSIKTYLFTEYSQYHELIHRFYNYCYKNKPNNKNSINYTIEELHKYKKCLPKYISEYFNDISKEIENINNHYVTIKQKITNDKILLTECISSDNITCVDNIIGYGVVKVTDKIIQMVTKD